jgi:sugar phosphate isomerase/epimerase
MNCYISSSCSRHRRLEDITRELAGLGFDRIELTGNVAFEDHIEAKIMKLRSDFGVEFLIHNYLPFLPEDFVLNLASAQEKNRRKTMEHIQRAVTLVGDLEGDLYTIHPGFVHDLIPEKEDHFFIRSSHSLNDRQTFYDGLRDVIRTLAQPHFKIGVENLAPRDIREFYSFLCTPDDLFGFLEEFRDLPSVGILLDLAHWNIAAQMLSFDKREVLDLLVRKHGERIFEVHLSENDGSRDHHRITDPNSWQIDFLAEHKARLAEKSITFEWQDCASKAAFERFSMIKKTLVV